MQGNYSTQQQQQQQQRGRVYSLRSFTHPLPSVAAATLCSWAANEDHGFR